MTAITQRIWFENAHLWLKVANHCLLASVLILLLVVMVCYPFSEYFSIPVQISGHIIMILDITLLKIAYVARLIMQHSLGSPLV